MAFSTGFGLICMCFIMLLFLPGQEQHQFAMTELQIVARKENQYDCCTVISKSLIRERVDNCYEQRTNRKNCKTHAYILITERDERYCVNPNARWLPARLQKLKKRGITCEPYFVI